MFVGFALHFVDEGKFIEVVWLTETAACVPGHRMLDTNSKSLAAQ